MHMTRTELDSFVAHHGLTRSEIETAFELVSARPSSVELRALGARGLRLAGLLSLAAGVIFFIAANWDAFAVLGRFALVGALLLACVGAALWRPPPQTLGRFALLGAFVVTGALLALYGQTYQTGANVYELFLSWTLLGLPFVIAAHWSVAWAAWILVLNVALALYCGFAPVGGLLWTLLSFATFNTVGALVLAMGVNFVLWLAIEVGEHTRWRDAISGIAPLWLKRLVIAAMIVFGTWAGTLAMAVSTGALAPMSGGTAVACVVVTVLLAAVGAQTFRRRDDVFPLAAIAGSVIWLGAAFCASHLGMSEIQLAFILAVWLIVTSTLAGRLLMSLFRDWRTQGERT
jgi:uncharacterized membrane protein